MITLEKRFYSIQELREALEVQQKKDILKNLDKLGYDFTWINRRGAEIIKLPEEGSPEQQLKCLLINRLGLDVQTDIKAFAAFFYMLQDDLFLTTPWESRAKILKQQFGIEVSDKTLRNYNSKLVKKDIMIKNNSDYEFWCSFYIGGEKYQEPVNDTDENDIKAMEDWFNKRKEYLEAADLEYQKAIGEADVKNPNRWKIAMNKLWDTTKTVYYKVRSWTFNAFDDKDIKEILRLSSLVVADIEPEEVEEIVEKEINYDSTNCTAADGSFKF